MLRRGRKLEAVQRQLLLKKNQVTFDKKSRRYAWENYERDVLHEKIMSFLYNHVFFTTKTKRAIIFTKKS